MELKKALVHTGICDTEELTQLRINIQMTEGFRNKYASSIRYFVLLKDRAICSVKKIPQNGIFNIENIIRTQKLFSEFDSCTAPKIYGVYHSDDGFVYIVEEAIMDSISLDYAVASSKLTSKEATAIMANIFQDISTQSSLDCAPDLLNREVEDFFIVAELLDFPTEIIKLLRMFLNENINKFVGSLLYTSRDLIPKNILVQKDKPFVVDFDLSRRTHFLWIDACRNKFYSTTIKSEHSKYMPDGIDPLMVELLFLLSEVRLQQRVLSEVQFFRSIGHLRSEIMFYCEKLFIANKLPSINTPEVLSPKIDGNQIPELSKNVLQLFWEDKNGFSEEASLKMPLLTDSIFHIYDMPFQINKNLRIDTGNQSAYIEIEKIAVFDCDPNAFKNAKPLAHWSAENGFNSLLPSNGVMQLDNKELFRFICTNEDPQLLLNNLVFPVNKQLLFLRLVMRVETQISESFVKTLELMVSLREEQLIQQNEDLLRVKAELSNKEKQLNLHIKELSRVEIELKINEEYLKQIFNSRSWRFSAPFRWICKGLRKTKLNK